MVTIFRIDDFWQSSDTKPGYSGSPVDSLANPDDIFGNDNLDHSPAFKRIIDAAAATHTAAGNPLNPVRIVFDTRVTYHFYSTIVINHPVEIIGIGIPNRSGSTRLVFHGCSGFNICRFPNGPSTLSIGMARIEGLAIEYYGSNTSNLEHSGIIVQRTSELYHLLIKGFPFHGIHMEGDVQDPSIDNANVSLSHVADCVVMNCGRTGVWVKGRDANVCSFSNINSFANGIAHVTEDGYGFYDESVLGNTYLFCHTRNNYLAGYCAAKFDDVAPNRSMYINCYSEHSAAPVPAAMQEGPALLDNNAMVITSMGDGSLVDAIGGCCVISSTLGRAQIRDTLEVKGKNDMSTIFGDNKVYPAGDKSPRISFEVESKAYGDGTNLSRYYFVHDPANATNAWCFKHNSQNSNPAPLGFTDAKHLRPGMTVAPAGILIGTSPNKTVARDGLNDGPRRIGYFDPRSETALSNSFPNALPGDLVLNSLPDKGSHNFIGWIFAFENSTPTGNKKWFRYGENLIGTSI